MHRAKNEQALTHSQVVIEDLRLFVGLTGEHEQRFDVESIDPALVSGLDCRRDPIAILVQQRPDGRQMLWFLGFEVKIQCD